jgi:hypothetical protein
VPDDYIICAGPEGNVIPGSAHARCVRCDAHVMIAPTGQQLRSRHGLRPLCIPCAAADGRGMQLMPVTPAQIAELFAYWAGRS